MVLWSGSLIDIVFLLLCGAIVGSALFSKCLLDLYCDIAVFEINRDTPGTDMIE